MSETTAVAQDSTQESVDLVGEENPSFALLQVARTQVLSSHAERESFEKQIEGLPATGEEGRRKGMGHWVLGDYVSCADQLSGYEGDDVADYTRARALMSLERYDEAQPLFKRLSDSYPSEPRPRGGMLEAQYEHALTQSEDPTDANTQLREAIDNSPEGFAESSEGLYLTGRLYESEGDIEEAISFYDQARQLDPTLRENVLRLAHLAERGGLDDLAVEVYEQSIQLRLADRAMFMNLGVLYEDLGRDQDAAACYDVVLQTYPTDPRAQLYLEDAASAIDMYYDEDLERKEDKLNQILRIPITDFELSVRARNCLNKMQIHTLGDLVCKTEQELLSYKNFGETSLNEIKEILRSKGLRLGMPREEAVASIESRARRTPGGGDTDDVRNKPITELQLSIRARRTVESLGCLTLGDITKHSADELLGMPNFGTTSLQELRSKLGEHNLKLAGE